MAVCGARHDFARGVSHALACRGQRALRRFSAIVRPMREDCHFDDERRGIAGQMREYVLLPRYEIAHAPLPCGCLGNVKQTTRDSNNVRS